MGKKVGLWELFLSFLKIGLFTFGGGYAMIPLIRDEVILRRGWVEEKNFVELLTLAQSAPGPIALNTSVFVGYSQRGYLGALAAISGIVVPSFSILLIVAIYFSHINDNEMVISAFKGIRPVVIALILAPTISLLKGVKWWMILFIIALTAALWWFAISPVYALLTAIFVGLIWGYTLKSGKL